MKKPIKLAYVFGRPSTKLNTLSLTDDIPVLLAYVFGRPCILTLKDDKPVCKNLTSSNKLLSTITVLSYTPVYINVDILLFRY